MLNDPNVKVPPDWYAVAEDQKWHYGVVEEDASGIDGEDEVREYVQGNCPF